MSRRVTQKEFYKPREKLTGEDVTEGSVIVLTVTRVQQVSNDDNRQSLVLEFEETDKVWWPNPKSIGRIIESLGDDLDQWEGEQLPLVVSKGVFKGQPYNNLWAAPVELWKGYLGMKRSPKAAAKRQTALRKPIGKGRK
jgi:hypothetical protein